MYKTDTMAKSYYLYQKYEKRGNQSFHPSYPVEYSVDGNGTMQKVVKMENDPNCDGVDPVRYQWVIVSGDYMCSGTTKCQKEKEQRSDDFGVTWTDTGRYRAGSPIEYNSVDCGWVPPQYRTVSGTPYCNGYTKMVDTYNQVSNDGGTTWQNTGVSGSVVVQYDSPDCGYPIYRWVDTDSYVCEDGGYGAQYFSIESLEDGNEIKYNGYPYGSFSAIISASTDNGLTWRVIAPQFRSPVTIATLNTGEKILLKGENSTYSYQSWDGTFARYYFTIDKPCNIYGNMMSLINGDDYYVTSTISSPHTFDGFFQNTKIVSAENVILPSNTTDYCYWNMFKGCSLLTATPELPASAMSAFSYAQMFEGCTSLTVAPELPATTMSSYCYWDMFHGCTGLTAAPALPATVMAEACYCGMFEGCTSLTTAPVLPATTLASACYDGMFEGCTSLTTAPELPATTLAGGCYGRMFRGCTGLTAAPVLSATTLANGCYSAMCENCTSLTTAPAILPATTLADDCYTRMFAGCTSLIIAPVLPATTTVTGCYTYMFSGCTSLTTVPEISATYIKGRQSNQNVTVAACCRTFQGCSSLNYIKCMATSIGWAGTVGWVTGVAASGTFVKNPNMSGWETGVDGIPSGWTVQDAS